MNMWGEIMYFPYLRGRQFELLALRELVEKNLIGDKVLPIIEPIKPTTTLAKTLECFIKDERKVALVFNPTVGDFKKEIEELKKEEIENDKVGVATSIYKQISNENIIKSYIMNKNISDKLNKKSDKKKFLIINKNRDCLDAYLNAYNDCFPKYSLIPDDRGYKKVVTKSKVLLKDCFTKQIRNVDYMQNQDEFFSDIHLNYGDDKFCGFSDYSIVGEEFNESGFAPLAVTIHLVYFNDKKELRIRHFVSDSNEDIKDPAGKFGEALEKLVLWCNKYNIYVTEGLKGLYDCHKTKKYPGLGTVKKLSIMHHIELMNMFLEGDI